MAERLTVQLEDGSVARLREMAGGERKVGAFLSMVTAWLYAQREHVDMANLSSYAIHGTAERETPEESLDVLLLAIGKRISHVEAMYLKTGEILARAAEISAAFQSGATLKLDADAVERLLQEAEQQEKTLMPVEEIEARTQEITNALKRRQPRGRQE